VVGAVEGRRCCLDNFLELLDEGSMESLREKLRLVRISASYEDINCAFKLQQAKQIFGVKINKLSARIDSKSEPD
jgi:hypothetical protein